MTGHDTFNQTYLDELTECFVKLDLKLPQSIHAQWSGFKELAMLKGNPPTDTWQDCSHNFTHKNNSVIIMF